MIECQKKPERELKKRLGGNVEETGRSVSNLKFLFICQWILEGRAYYGDVLSERVEIGYCPSHQQDGGRSTALGNLLHGLLLAAQPDFFVSTEIICISSCLWPLVMFRALAYTL